MNKIIITRVKKELIDLGVDNLTIQLMVNNLSMYNDLIKEYNNDSKEQAYLMYQLSIQIFKMLNEIKKEKKLNRDSKSEDKLTTLINNLKGKIETR